MSIPYDALPAAKTRQQGPYEGNTQYLGRGIQTSCGKCGKHSAPAGRKRHPVLGYVNRCCLG